jgi:hypothetical protein
MTWQGGRRSYRLLGSSRPCNSDDSVDRNLVEQFTKSLESKLAGTEGLYISHLILT